MFNQQTISPKLIKAKYYPIRSLKNKTFEVKN